MLWGCGRCCSPTLYRFFLGGLRFARPGTSGGGWRPGQRGARLVPAKPPCPHTHTHTHTHTRAPLSACTRTRAHMFGATPAGFATSPVLRCVERRNGLSQRERERGAVRTWCGKRGPGRGEGGRLGGGARRSPLFFYSCSGTLPSRAAVLAPCVVGCPATKRDLSKDMIWARPHPNIPNRLWTPGNHTHIHPFFCGFKNIPSHRAFPHTRKDIKAVAKLYERRTALPTTASLGAAL